jgi:formylglycine-generating enzyme required for sulfatase activity
MKRLLILVVSVFSAMCLPTFAADNAGKTRASVLEDVQEVLGKDVSIPTYHALIIGINKYKQWQELRQARPDAEKLARLLKNRYGFTDVIEIYDEQATRSEILRQLRKVTVNLKSQDAVLIYFAGHGYYDKPPADSGYWIPAEAPEKNDDQPATSEWVQDVQIKEALSKTEARHVLVLSDACFSGALFRGTTIDEKAKVPAYYRMALSQPVRWAITSGDLETVPDESVFSRKIVQALEYPRTNVFAASDIVSWIKNDVTELTGRKPRFGPLRTASSSESGEFVFLCMGQSDEPQPPETPKKETVIVPPSPPPPPPPGNNAKARIAYDELLAVLDTKRDLTTDRQIAYLEDFITDWSGTTAAKEAEAKIAELRAIEDLRGKAQTRFAGLVDRDKIEVLTQSDANRRRDAWNAYVTEFKDTRHQIDYARQRMTYYASWKSGPCPGDTQTYDLGGGVQLEMVYIPPGEFMMGSPANEANRSNDETQHRVKLTKGFWMGKHEVTQEQWERIMGNNPSNFKGVKNPVEQVSWNDCQEFVGKLNGMVSGRRFRLPTEAEWEYACRAETTAPFHYGESLDATMANFDGNYPYGLGAKGEYRQKTVAVGSFQANKWGLYDMHGNVWEWCQDWYGDYPTSAVSDPAGPGAGDVRVIRGGGWVGNAGFCRSAYRSWNGPGNRGDGLGFRLARTE